MLCPPPRGHAWTRADDRYVTCGGCYDKLRARITEVAERYLKLDPRPGAQFESGGRGAPGFGSRPPLSLHVVAMRDGRSSQDARMWVGRDGRVHAEEENPPLSVHGVLSTLAWDVAEHRGVAGPGDRDSVYLLLQFLDRHVDHITRHAELTTEVDEQLRALVAALRPLTGDRRRRIGKCPVLVEVETESGEPEKVRCSATLYAPMDDGFSATIACHVCGNSWAMDEWLSLGDALDPETAS